MVINWINQQSFMIVMKFMIVMISYEVLIALLLVILSVAAVTDKQTNRINLLGWETYRRIHNNTLIIRHNLYIPSTYLIHSL